MGFWGKLGQALGMGVQMAAPMAGLAGPEVQAILRTVEVVLAGAQTRQPEKAIEAAFQALGIPLLNYEVRLLDELAQKVQQRFEIKPPPPPQAPSEPPQ